MRRLISSAALFLLTIALSSPVLATPINHLWSKGLGSNDFDTAQAVAVDAAGNVYITGYFSTSTNLGGGTLVSAGGSDIFLAKYSPSGAHLWSKRFGSTGNDHGNGVGVDALGNVSITGDFTGTADFDIGSLVSAGGTDVFVARFTTGGGYLGAQRYGGTTNDIAYSLAVDSGGNIIITGSFTGTAAFGGASLVSLGGTEIFLAKYSSAGTHVWSERWGGTVSDAAQAVAVDPSGNITITGTFQGTTNLGGANLVAGSIEAFVARYTSGGAHSWSYRLGGASQDFAMGVACDGSGNVYCTGYFQGSGTFPTAVLVAAGGFDGYLLKFNAAGTQQWAQRFGGTDSEYPNWVTTDASGNVVVTGMFYTTTNLGGSNLVSNGDIDVFIGEFNSAGVHRWSRSFGGTLADRGNMIVTTASGDAVVTGYFNATLDFGGGLVGSAGSADAFVARYTEHSIAPAITSISDIGNDQGRKVRITFDRSAHDISASPTQVNHYEAYRRNDAPPSTALAGLARLTGPQLLASGWTQVATVDAHAENAYSMDAPTVGDSTIALGQYRSTFYVRAATGAPATFFDSAPDSGYSVDNLAPGIPQNLIYSAGDLTWDESTAEDFDYFRVYGSNTNDFGAATLVNYSVSPGMDVTGSPYAYYFVTATDFSGNEGRPAKVNRMTGVGGMPEHYVLSLSNYPNPFNPETTVKYTLPSKGEVTVAIYDASGAKVAILVDHVVRTAGAYETRWGGRSASGSPVSSGVYFARIDYKGGAMTRKMVLLK
jgi:hypothetical protein